jgi:putative nucleotidyltransferase with HDIG domain
MEQRVGELDKKILAAVDKMPAFPKSVQRILDLTRNIACAPKELVQVIEKDPVMTIKLLKILNSAYYNFPKKVTSVSQCVVYLGLNTVKNLALNIAAIGILPKQNAAGFDLQQYLLHALTTANLAKLLCGRLPATDLDPMDCYIVGLLHDFGKLVFAQFMADEFHLALEISRLTNLPLYQAEREIIGVDHSVVGSMLAERWQFPPALVSSIRQHHEPPTAGDAMGACLVVGNALSKKLGFGFSGNPCVEDLPAGVLQAFGASDLDGILALLGDTNRVLDEAKLFANLEGAA